MPTTIAIILAVLSAGLLAAVLWLLLDRGKAASHLAAARSERDAAAQARDAALQDRAARDTELATLQGKLGEAERESAVIAERERALQQQQAQLREELLAMREQLKESFDALAGKALERSSESFLTLAKKTFEKEQATAQGDLEKKQQAVEELVKPIRELLEKQRTAVQQLEEKREGAYAKIEEQLKHVVTANEKLDRETGRLVSALRRPEQRGRWGEMQLRNTVELAGMTGKCDFDEQVSLWKGDTRQRPDMVVHLPGKGVIPVDSKVALDAYLDALQPDADRDALMKRHADQVETHMKSLAVKRYWEGFDSTNHRAPQLVVMFMPLESALVSALEVKPDLHATAMQQHVLIATPTLLVALLRAVAYGWQQEDIAANARQIADVGRELYDRLGVFADHFEKVGSNLQRATKSYNNAVGSLERMVLSSARKLKELHATNKEEIEAPTIIERETREITAGELRVSGDSE
jgi:DNA recombination protein RmuC